MNTYQDSLENKRNFKLFTISIRKNFLEITFCIFAISLVIFSNSNLIAAKNGLILWATAVVPSLFPFFVATELLSYTNVVPFLGKVFSKIIRPLFGVPGEATFAFIMGMISGYPVGAKITSEFVLDGICTREEGERMLAFTNNSGPLFIVGTVGITLFGNTTIGLVLLVTHILSCITVGIVLNFFSISPYKPKLSRSAESINNRASKISSLGELLGKSIQNATSTILLIGGFVVIFSVILSIFNQIHLFNCIETLFLPITNVLNLPSDIVPAFFSGLIELTNGVNAVSQVPIKAISINIILCAFLLGFGGISVLLQVFSITSKANISIRKYILGKLLQGTFAAIYTFIALQILPFLQLNL